MKILHPARLVSALLGLLAMTLLGCSQGGDPALIGKWKVKDADHVLEIRANGDWVEAMDKDAQVTSCKWEWDGTNRIRVTAQSKLVGKATGTMKVALNGDKLVLTEEGAATEYTRVK